MKQGLVLLVFVLLSLSGEHVFGQQDQYLFSVPSGLFVTPTNWRDGQGNSPAVVAPPDMYILTSGRTATVSQSIVVTSFIMFPSGQSLQQIPYLKLNGALLVQALCQIFNNGQFYPVIQTDIPSTGSLINQYPTDTCPPPLTNYGKTCFNLRSDIYTYSTTSVVALSTSSMLYWTGKATVGGNGVLGFAAGNGIYTDPAAIINLVDQANISFALTSLQPSPIQACLGVIQAYGVNYIFASGATMLAANGNIHVHNKLTISGPFTFAPWATITIYTGATFVLAPRFCSSTLTPPVIVEPLGTLAVGGYNDSVSWVDVLIGPLSGGGLVQITYATVAFAGAQDITFQILGAGSPQPPNQAVFSSSQGLQYLDCTFQVPLGAIANFITGSTNSVILIGGSVIAMTPFAQLHINPAVEISPGGSFTAQNGASVENGNIFVNGGQFTSQPGSSVTYTHFYVSPGSVLSMASGTYSSCLFYACSGPTSEMHNLTITCPLPSQTMTSIIFASYGNPTGTCGDYSLGSCNSANSVTKVSARCQNVNSCNILVSSAFFENDPCPGTVKSLIVQAECA